MSQPVMDTENRRTTTVTPSGQIIIAREYGALAPHPHPDQNGRLVTIADVNRLLVEASETPDGVEKFECNACGKVFDTVVATRGHLPIHSDVHRRRYSPRDLAFIIAAVEWVRHRIHARNYNEIAADILNEMPKINRTDKQPWTSEAISKLVVTYNCDPTVRPLVVPAWRIIDNRFAKKYVLNTTTTSKSTVVEIEVSDDVDASDDQLSRIRRMITTAERDVLAVGSTLRDTCEILSQVSVLNDADIASLREKAEKLEMLQNLLGNGAKS